MRIIFDNVLDSAGLSATNADPNYPVEAITEKTLETIFKATTNSTTITAILGEQATISGFAFGNHNLNTLTVTLTKSDLSTEVFPYSGAELYFSQEDTRKMLYITPVDNVIEIAFSCTSTDKTYLGGLWAERYLQTPPFSILPDIGYRDTSSRQKSRYGVKYGNPGTELETFSCVFGGVLITGYDAMNVMMRFASKSRVMWVDRWEESTEFPYLFAERLNDISWKKGAEGVIFDDLRLRLEECA